LAGALGGAAGRTRRPSRAGRGLLGHVTGDRTGGLPQTDAPLAQAERRASWDTPAGFGAWPFAQHRLALL